MAYTTKETPHGLTHNLRAPFSGVIDEEIIKDSLATLPESITELKAAWAQVGQARNSGVVLSTTGEQLGYAVCEGVWWPSL